MLRITTGKYKGKLIKTLEGEATRPTSERIKQAIFSSIQFDVEGRRVLDLFAGSGQMGLEALSRGAVEVTFIDLSRDALDIVKENAKRLGVFDECRYLASDWKNYIRKASGRVKFDLIFIDPPYSLECARDAAYRLKEYDLLARGAIIVLESGEEAITPDSLDGFEVLKSTHYGKKTFVNILLFRGDEE